MASTLIAIAETRLALLSTEFAEDRARLLSLACLALIALFCLGLAALLGSLLFLILCWEEHRLLALAILAGSYLAIGVGCGSYALRLAHRQPRLFTASLAALAADRQRLRD